MQKIDYIKEWNEHSKYSKAVSITPNEYDGFDMFVKTDFLDVTCEVGNSGSWEIDKDGKNIDDFEILKLTWECACNFEIIKEDLEYFHAELNSFLKRLNKNWRMNGCA